MLYQKRLKSGRFRPNYIVKMSRSFAIEDTMRYYESKQFGNWKTIRISAVPIMMHIAALSLLTFIYNIRDNYKFQIHEPYVIYPPDVKNLTEYLDLLIKEDFELADSKRFECDGSEKGPFALMGTPINGISNQFHYIHDILIMMYGFAGTIVLPKYSSTRLPLLINETVHRWELKPIDKSYDIVAMIGRLRLIGFRICIESAYRKMTGRFFRRKFFDWHREVRNCGNKVGCSGRSFSRFLSYYNNETCLILPNIWGATPIPHTTQLLTPTLQLSKQISNAIKFAELPQRFGEKLLNELWEVARSKRQSKLVVIHLRVERDWRAHMQGAYTCCTGETCTTEELLQPYVAFFKRISDPQGLYYLAVGQLFHDEEHLAFSWANSTFGDRWIIKERLRVFKEIANLSADHLAIMENYVIMKADSFVGNGASSFSYIASEKRNHRGLQSHLVLPLAEIYYPLFGTRTFISSEKPFARLNK